MEGNGYLVEAVDLGFCGHDKSENLLHRCAFVDGVRRCRKDFSLTQGKSRLPWQSRIPQKKFHRNSPGVTVRVLNGDSNLAATSEIDHPSQVLMRFREYWTIAGGTHIKLLRAS